MADDSPKAEDMDAIDVGEDMDDPSPPLPPPPPLRTLPVNPAAPHRTSDEWKTEEVDEVEDGSETGDGMANPILSRASGCCECGCDGCCCWWCEYIRYPPVIQATTTTTKTTTSANGRHFTVKKQTNISSIAFHSDVELDSKWNREESLQSQWNRSRKGKRTKF